MRRDEQQQRVICEWACNCVCERGAQIVARFAANYSSVFAVFGVLGVLNVAVVVSVRSNVYAMRRSSGVN